MIEILNSLFAGITFSVGVVIGALLCRMATEKGRKEAMEESRDINRKIHDRLDRSLECHERLACAAEEALDIQRNK